MTPTTTGIYTLRLPNGKVVQRRVKRYGDDLTAIEPRGFLGLFSALVPLDMVEGTWVFEQETAGI